MKLFIAFGLALPVLATGLIFRNTKATVFAALVMAGIGIGTGNPRYAATDVVAVGVGLFVALQFCEPSKATKHQREIRIAEPTHQESPVVYVPTSVVKAATESPQTLVTAQTRTILDYSILQRDISPEENELLRKHLSFYEELELGLRKPESEAQRHFLDVLKGRATPRTTHEVAFLKHMKRRDRKI